MLPRLHLYGVCLGAVGLVAVLGWSLVAAAQARAQASTMAATQAEQRATTVLSRLTRVPVSRQGAPLPDHVATLARRVLVTAGLGQEALAGIQPLGDSELPGGVWHRQQILLQLRGLSTSQAAAVVDAVARTDPSWAVASIQLTHVGMDDTYDAGLSVTTFYPAQP